MSVVSHDRSERRDLERRAKEIHFQGCMEGWSRDRIVDEVVHRLPKVTRLEAHRFANGWTRREVSRALDYHYERAGLRPPRLPMTEVWGWEHARHVPNAERQDFLCRVYRTRPDRLGFGRDFSVSHETGGSATGAHGIVTGPGYGSVGIASGPHDRIVGIAWQESDAGASELLVEIEDGDRDGRVVLRLVGSVSVPAELVPASDSNGSAA